MSHRNVFTGWLLFISIVLPTALAHAERKTENVFLITTDGLRWQEIFAGADATLMNRQAGGIRDVETARRQFWADTPEARREMLMPFLWKNIARNGQIFGNKQKASPARVTNLIRLSFPGYNEMLTGKADPAITDNAQKPNANVTVLEWLHGQEAFRGRVAAFSGWQTMSSILNRERCGFPVFAGWEQLPEKDPSPRQQLLNELLATTTRIEPEETHDSLLFAAAVEHVKRHKPRVMFISFMETDHWGHGGRYDLMLQSARSYDDYVRKLWELVQSMPEYRDKTTFILLTDHGRGGGPESWKSHNQDIAGAEDIWMAFLGPDTPPLGERTKIPAVTQSQLAATLAALLGTDYHAAVPGSAPPIKDVLPSE